MKRPLKPVSPPTREEQQRERRFTRRIMMLAVAGGLIGSCANLALRTMGSPPRPAGAVAAPGEPSEARRDVSEAAVPPRTPGSKDYNAPRLPGK